MYNVLHINKFILYLVIKLLCVSQCNADMQRPRRNRLPEGSYAEDGDSDNVELEEISHTYTNEEDEDESADSDDEFVDEAPVAEVDRCEINYIITST